MWDELPEGWNPWYGRRIRPAWNGMLAAILEEGPLDRRELAVRAMRCSDILPGTVDTVIREALKAGALTRMGHNGRVLNVSTWMRGWLHRADPNALLVGPGLQEAMEVERERARA